MTTILSPECLLLDHPR